MKKLLLACTLTCTATQLRTETVAKKIGNNVENAADQVNNIWQNMERMRHNAEDMFQELSNRFSEEIIDLQNLAANTWEKISSPNAQPLRITISEKDTNNVTVAIDGITAPAKDESFFAHISYDQEDNPSKLVVSSKGQTITITYTQKFNHIGVSVSRERSVSQTDEKGNVVSERQSMVNKSYGQTISSEVQLDEPTIDYSSDEQQLIISLPKVRPTEKKKSVQVNLK